MGPVRTGRSFPFRLACSPFMIRGSKASTRVVVRDGTKLNGPSFLGTDGRPVLSGVITVDLVNEINTFTP